MDPMQRWLLEAAYRALENGMFLYMYKESSRIDAKGLPRSQLECQWRAYQIP
jgi:hypothetical protein